MTDNKWKIEKWAAGLTLTHLHWWWSVGVFKKNKIKYTIKKLKQLEEVTFVLEWLLKGWWRQRGSTLWLSDSSPVPVPVRGLCRIRLLPQHSAVWLFIWALDTTRPGSCLNVCVSCAAAGPRSHAAGMSDKDPALPTCWVITCEVRWRGNSNHRPQVYISVLQAEFSV